MEHDSQPEAYHIHVWIRGIHPMLWRRFLVRSDGNGNSEEGRIAPALKCSPNTCRPDNIATVVKHWNQLQIQLACSLRCRSGTFVSPFGGFVSFASTSRRKCRRY